MTAPRTRAGHSDRQAAVDGLSLHFTEGRLDTDEFDERVRQAYAATYLDELPALFADLPREQPRRGNEFTQSWPGPYRSGPLAPAPRSDHRPGPQRPQFHRPPRLLAVFVVFALVFSIGALTQGVFPFPLIWIALTLLLVARAARRRRWSEYSSYCNRR